MILLPFISILLWGLILALAQALAPLHRTVTNRIGGKKKLAGFGSKLVKGILSVGGGVLQMIVSLIIAGILLATAGAGEAIRKVYRKLAGTRGDEFSDMTYTTVGNVVKGILVVIPIVIYLFSLLKPCQPYYGRYT